MANLNKVFLIGNLTKDPEIKYAGSGTAITNFAIATNRNWTSAEGEKKEEVCFVNITAFAKRAEVVADFFKKGDSIFIEGHLKFEQWETKDGQKRNMLKVIMDNFQFQGNNKKEGKSNWNEKEEAAPKEDIKDMMADNKEEDINDEEIPF